MKAIHCVEYSEKDNLSVVDIPNPIVGDNQVLIDTKISTLNYPDLLQMKGLYQVKPDLPYIPGTEVTGIVTEVGKNVTSVNIGDHVLGKDLTGGLAEQFCTEEINCLKLPKDLPFDIGASITYSYGTAYYGLVDRGNLKPGETLLVLGATGSVGLAAIQLGKVLGAHVVAATSTEDKFDICKKNGADEVIVYKQENLKQDLKNMTKGKGFNVVFDTLGDQYTEAALRATAWKGRFLVVGFIAGGIPKIPLNLPLLKNCDIIGVFWGGFINQEPENAMKNAVKLLDLHKSKQISPNIYKVFPLSDVELAIKVLSDKSIIGRVLLVP